jgi:hypothetical protein
MAKTSQIGSIQDEHIWCSKEKNPAEADSQGDPIVRLCCDASYINALKPQMQDFAIRAEARQHYKHFTGCGMAARCTSQ